MSSLQLIHRLKKETQSPQSHVKIATLKSVNAYLRPVQAKREDALLMAKWRTETYQSFFTWIQPNEVEMLEWLMRYENVDNDIIFLVEAPEPIGQMSIYNVDMDEKLAEFGRLIRGEKKGSKGLMSHACAALLRWAFSCLQLNEITLEVFADNQKAIALYRRLGFYVSNIVLFSKTKTTEGIVRWVEVKEAKGAFCDKGQYRKVCNMVLNSEDFHGKFGTFEEMEQKSLQSSGKQSKES